MLLDSAQPVLTHCSDGWDRTSQIVSLAMIILDPFYRTINGFAVLVEKEWIAFGHNFALRSGHGVLANESVSPIFLIFIECVWQLTRQCPTAFEFNEEFLVMVMDELYACRFGTFLANNERESYELRLRERTVSLWTEVDSRREEFLNPFFEEEHKALRVSASMRAMMLWERYYLRWASEANMSASPLVAAAHKLTEGRLKT